MPRPDIPHRRPWQLSVSAGVLAGVALAAQLLGLVLAFGVRALQHLRTTGTVGFNGISGPRGSLPWWGGVLFVGALVLGLAAPVAVIAEVSVPGTVLPPAAIAAVGAVVEIAGLGIVLAAQQAMGASWRIGVDDDERTELITGSLFAHVRNPVFTGLVAAQFGALLLVPSPISALALACLVTAVEIQVRRIEEPHLRRVHGSAYLAYMRSTGRFLPRAPRRTEDPAGTAE